MNSAGEEHYREHIFFPKYLCIKIEQVNIKSIIYNGVKILGLQDRSRVAVMNSVPGSVATREQ